MAYGLKASSCHPFKSYEVYAIVLFFILYGSFNLSKQERFSVFAEVNFANIEVQLCKYLSQFYLVTFKLIGTCTVIQLLTAWKVEN